MFTINTPPEYGLSPGLQYCCQAAVKLLSLHQSVGQAGAAMASSTDRNVGTAGRLHQHYRHRF